MASVQKQQEPLTISGNPRRLYGYLPNETLPAGPGSLQLFSPKGEKVGEPVSVILRKTKTSDLTKVKFKLDRTIPAGRYSAELRLGNKKQSLDLQIEPQVRLHVQPSILSLQGAPGATVAGEFLLINRGNVPFEMPALGTPGIFLENGVENAFAAAYRSEAEDGLELIKKFAEELKRSHGGLLKLKVTRGAGVLSPGASNVICVSTKLPEKLAPKRTYSGFWFLGNLNYTVQVSVDENRGPRRGKK